MLSVPSEQVLMLIHQLPKQHNKDPIQVWGFWSQLIDLGLLDAMRLMLQSLEVHVKNEVPHTACLMALSGHCY